MGTTTQKLQKVLDSKNAIRTAIQKKIGIDPGDTLSTYATVINNLSIKSAAPMKLNSSGEAFYSNDMSWEAYPLTVPQANQSSAFEDDKCVTYLNLGLYLKDVNPTHLNNMFTNAAITSFDFGNVNLAYIQDGFRAMFANSSLDQVTFFTRSNNVKKNMPYSHMFANAYLTDLVIEDLDLGCAEMENFAAQNLLTRVTLKDLTFEDTTGKGMNGKLMFSENTKLTSVTLDNVHVYNGDLTGMFLECTSLVTVDFSKFYFHPYCLIDEMFYGCTKLASVTILDDLYNIACTSNVFYNIKTRGTFYYDPYYYNEEKRFEDTDIYLQIPSTWTKTPLIYGISKNKSLSISVAPDTIINQYTTSVDVIYNLNTDGTIGNRTITDRILSDTVKVSCTQNTTGKDRTITLSYTKNGLTAETTVVQKYLTPTFDLSGSSWKKSTSTLVTGTYKYECYGGGDEINNLDEAMYVTIPAGINSIQFDCYSDTEGPDYMYIEDNTYYKGYALGISGENHHTSVVISFKKYFGEEWDKTQPIDFSIRYTKDSSVAEGTDKVYFGLTLLS